MVKATLKKTCNISQHVHVKRKPVLASLLLFHRSCTLGKSLVIGTWLVQMGWTATWHTSNSISALLWASCYKTRRTDLGLFSRSVCLQVALQLKWPEMSLFSLSDRLNWVSSTYFLEEQDRLFLFPKIAVYYYLNFHKTVEVIQDGKRSWIPTWKTRMHGPKLPIRESLQMTGGPKCETAGPVSVFYQALCLTVPLLIHPG